MGFPAAAGMETDILINEGIAAFLGKAADNAFIAETADLAVDSAPPVGKAGCPQGIGQCTDGKLLIMMGLQKIEQLLFLRSGICAAFHRFTSENENESRIDR